MRQRRLSGRMRGSGGSADGNLAGAHARSRELARPLLQQAIKRVPANPDAFSDLVKADVATKNFVEAAETLHLQEVTFQTDLTATVNASPDFAEFREFLPYTRNGRHDTMGQMRRRLYGCVREISAIHAGGMRAKAESRRAN